MQGDCSKQQLRSQESQEQLSTRRDPLGEAHHRGRRAGEPQQAPPHHVDVRSLCCRGLPPSPLPLTPADGGAAECLNLHQLQKPELLLR
ncbi:unnamed protein product [Rangifer tarandus platyrhynchus]|uniref:Uncharacterized protein n=1 Tax=Rangifer tarandus platyrhynchus TaxID=3082113 RepID=A0AC59ZF38_RANTA